MAAESTSFLPRILSVFYAVFHDHKGTNIVYQVPEGLIATPHGAIANSLCASPGSSDQTEYPGPASTSRASSSSLNSHLAGSRDTFASSLKRSSSTYRTLFNFDDISKYIIPPKRLSGRLVTCATRRHRILGFPVELFDENRYERNFFRFNVCFVFDRTADLSCYEPVVRKIGRVLTACEEESSFLSSPQTSHDIRAILEQLYEDLNSYSETSIPIDKFNSIELKIFPFYPNPPPVKDWQVPVALINLKKRIEDNWDLTMAKVCSFIDGTNHVSRIAHLADCDLVLTRKAISHLLYYQVIMMIDIFQFNNMYTLCRTVEWLADESNVMDECGPYVTRPDRQIAEWPDLLHLYSRLKPGITVLDWMREYDVHNKFGIDPRRFVSFGVIKGFLRRVHRWPFLSPEKGRRSPTSGRRRGKSLSIGNNSLSPTVETVNRRSDGSAIVTNGLSLQASDERTLVSPLRRASAAERSLGLIRKELEQKGTYLGGSLSGTMSATSSPRATRYIRHYQPGFNDVAHRRNSLQQPISGHTAGHSNGYSEYGENNVSGLSTPTRPRLSRSPSRQRIPQTVYPGTNAPVEIPSGLKEMLDGSHHTDELGVLFEAGWPLLERYLVSIGEGKGDGDFGRVAIIYR